MSPRGTAHVAIIGAGPAGAATALALCGHGLRVTVVERSRLDQPTVGEHLSPDALPALDALALLEPIRAGPNRPCAGVCSFWGSDRRQVREYMNSAFGPGLNLSRPWFDRYLHGEILRRGGIVYLGAKVRELARVGHRWRLDVRDGETNRVFAADFLVDASGRSAWLARRLGCRRVVHDRLVGLVRFHDPIGHRRTDDAMLQIEAIEDGWWYSAVLGDGRLVTAFMTDADRLATARTRLQEAWSSWLDAAPFTQARCARRACPSAILVRSACSQRLDAAIGPGWLAVGDAASSLDPLSSSGISKGLSGGLRAADTIQAYLGGETTAAARYQDAVASDYEDYLMARHLYYKMELRWHDAPFWRRRRALPLDAFSVTIDPHIMLRTTLAARSSMTLLPGVTEALLYRVARRPIPAHRLASALREACDGAYKDQEIVAVMQLLLRYGFLQSCSGERRPATLVTEPLFDPKGERMRT